MWIHKFFFKTAYTFWRKGHTTRGLGIYLTSIQRMYISRIALIKWHTNQGFQVSKHSQVSSYSIYLFSNESHIVRIFSRAQVHSIISYIYQDLELAMIGEFVNGLMVSNIMNVTKLFCSPKNYWGNYKTFFVYVLIR